MASMARVNSTRLRRSGMRKIFANFSNMGLLPIIMPCPLSGIGQSIRETLADQNYLAAGLLDLLLRGLRKLVRVHGQRHVDLAIPEDLQQLIAFPEEALRDKCFQGQLRITQFGQPVEVQHGVFSPEDV